MANFRARVELHGVGHDAHAYQILHNVMATMGFSREVVKGGMLYELPTGLYSITSALPLERIASFAKTAADAVTFDNELVVDEYVATTWEGLRVIGPVPVPVSPLIAFLASRSGAAVAPDRPVAVPIPSATTPTIRPLSERIGNRGTRPFAPPLASRLGVNQLPFNNK